MDVNDGFNFIFLVNQKVFFSKSHSTFENNKNICTL
jgi:hypothetical protein